MLPTVMTLLAACETAPQPRKHLPPPAREPAAIRYAIDQAWLTETPAGYETTERGRRALDGHRRMRASLGD